MRMLLRGGFLALILLGLASQAIRAGRDDKEADPRVALLGGLARLHIETTDLPGSPELLMARSPRCGQPFLVGLMTISGAEDETARRLSRPDIVTRYVFLGSVTAHPSRTALIGRWGWATLLFDVGLRRDRPPQLMVLVAAPRGCTGLDATDWSALSPAT